MKRNTKWILQLIILGICWAHVKSFDWGNDFPIKTEIGCDLYPIALGCPGSDVIQIVTAEYGRQNTDTCITSSGKMRNTKCFLPEAKEIVENLCNNQTQCSFQVSSANFPDPCPGTHKYLKTTFNCVKYMFGCPGSLTGIGSEIVTAVEIQPQSGTWTKDPLSSPDHVFFMSSSQQIIQEYRNWDDFVTGNPSYRYNLPSKAALGNIVVYDRNLYYVKANSRSIIRYSLITQRRTKETVIQPETGITQNRDISLSVDENGIWVIYPRQRGLITISKLDKDQLTISETWNTNLRISESLHTFIICGVLYSISSSTGQMDYFYNTELKQEKRGINVPFDAVRAPNFAYGNNYRSDSGRRSFLRYNATSVAYSPRDRLLYVWDENNANAVYYKLHFDDGNKNGGGGRVKTTKSTYTTRILTTPKRKPTTRTTTTRHAKPTLVSSVPVQPLPSVGEPDEDFFPLVDFCFPITRGNINWPKTNIGHTAIMSCSDGSGEFATWKCVREPSMREAAWHVAGPDLSKCITWANDVETKFDAGLIDRATAFSTLALQISEKNELSEKSVQLAIELMKKLLEDPALGSVEEVEIILESVTTIANKILNSAELMKDMNTKKKAEIADTLMNEVEKAAFLYADSVAMTPPDTRNNEPFIIENDKMIVQVDVRERKSEPMTTESVTSFPSEESCAFGTENCGDDVIRIHDSEIMGQKGLGPATVVFALYQNLGDFLDQSSNDVIDEVTSWKIDSKVISATFRGHGFQTKLDKPAVIVLEHKKPSHLPHRCVYWDYSESTNSGNWSDAGCQMIQNNKSHTTCECDHLTSFAVLVNHAGVTMAPIDDVVLDIITSIGICISIVCLVMCIFTFCYFRNLYNDRNTIHKHLCICLLIAETIFLIGINQTQNKIACSIIAGSLHYFFLAAFCWMTLEGFQLYVMLVEVFEANSSRWKWYYLVGYGVPALIVGVSAGIDHAGYGTDSVCWLEFDSGFIWSFAGPILVIILLNLIFLSITVYKMYVHTMSFTDSGKINSIKASVRGASVLLCLLGITWAFGFLWISEHMTVVAYLFCIFNAFQGMFIFIFHCLLPRKIREEYKRAFDSITCCQRMQRGTYASNSMSFSKRYTPERTLPNGLTCQASQNAQSQLQIMWNETVAPKATESSPIAGSEISANILHDRVTQSLSRELSNMQGVSLRDRSNSTSSFLYFYSVDKTPHKPDKPAIFGSTEPRPVRRHMVIVPTCKRHTIIIPDSSRVTMGTRGFSTRNLQQNHTLQQEDEVFLPSQPEFESHPHHQNETMLQNSTNEVSYDRLQHHRHQEAPFYSHPHPPPGRFHTGIPPSFRHYNGDNRTSTVAQHDCRTHHHAMANTQSHVNNFTVHSSTPRLAEAIHQCGNEHHLKRYPERQSSYDDNIVNRKRDSGISINNLPQNSILPNMEHDAKRSHDNLIYHANGPNIPIIQRQSQPIRLENSQRDIYSPSDSAARRLSQPIRIENEILSSNQNCPLVSSDDERHNELQYSSSNTQRSELAQNCAARNNVAGNRTNPTSRLQNVRRCRKSLSSESDDPIVTDCSITSSAGSSLENASPSIHTCQSIHETLPKEPYYEEPICVHKRRLPNPPISVRNHKEHWHPTASIISDHSRDETDFEVERLTSDACANDYDTSTDYQLSPLSSIGHSDGTSRSEFTDAEEKLISAPAGYRTGMVGNSTYSSMPVNVGGRNVPQMGCFGQKIFPSSQNSVDYSQNPNTYLSCKQPSIHEDMGTRMITNL
ncbi:adhesion G protein-coupled receptor L3-like isoform X1 [Styela clava]